ncbi:MAG: hypothetical protein JWO74_628 [Solirubrobacterales bacterium]|nr:hypothetical protein [Solirubrobacterales bacterium]
MRRPDTTLDPLVAEELERLDAALAGSADADPGLEALVRDVRAEAPEMTPAFRGALDDRVRAGFPRARRFAWRPSRTLLVPALGAAATLLIAVAVIGLAGGGGGPGGSGGTGKASSSAGTVSGAAPGAASAAPPVTRESAVPQKSAPVAPPLPLTGGASGRQVERAAQLTLTSAPADVQDVADGVIRTAGALGGYVETSQISSSDQGGGASLRLRVPSARLDDAIARLSELAHVGSLTRASTDITAPVVSATSRLGDARAERDALLRALGKATTDREIASLRERLRLNRSQIAALEGELAGLRRRANMATVDVTVEGTGPKAGAGTGGAWTPKDALHDALRVLEVAAGVTLVACAVLVPLALLAALGALAARGLRRRRRDAALDAA